MSSVWHQLNALTQGFSDAGCTGARVRRVGGAFDRSLLVATVISAVTWGRSGDALAHLLRVR